MKYSLLLLITIAFFFACGDEYYGISDNDDDGPTYSTIETEPTLSANGAYIYYISTDTLDPFYSGIFRVTVASPSRQKLVHGTGYHSPTINFSNMTLAYLDSGRINYQSLYDLSHYESPLPDSFASIAFIRDTILAACRNDSIFVVTDSGEISPLISSGWDPTALTEDTFLHVTGKAPNYFIIKNNIYGIRPETLAVLSGVGRPRWPDLMSGFNYVSYEIADLSRHHFYVRKFGADSSIAIAASGYSKAIFLMDGRILFTGDNGQFLYSRYVVDNP